MAADGRTGQDAEKTRGSRGTDGSSRAAFRTFIRRADELIPELRAEAISETEAWQNFDDAVADLVVDVYRAFRGRVRHVMEERATPSWSTIPGEAPPADEQPSAVPG